MENGLPSKTTITLDRSTGVMYDLVEHHQVQTSISTGKLTTKLNLGPCDGRLLLVTPELIHQVIVKGPKAAKQGEEISVNLTIADAAGQPIPAVIPVEVTIEDSEGRTAEFSGYRATINGQITFKLNVASNDKAGTWRNHVRELASGKTGTTHVRVISKTIIPHTHTKINGFNPVQPAG